MFLRLIIINEAKTRALMDGHAVYIEFIFKVMKTIFARNSKVCVACETLIITTAIRTSVPLFIHRHVRTPAAAWRVDQQDAAITAENQFLALRTSSLAA
jgi:hypothetical protein